MKYNNLHSYNLRLIFILKFKYYFLLIYVIYNIIIIIKKRNNVKCFIFRYARNDNYKEKYIYEDDLYK